MSPEEEETNETGPIPDPEHPANYPPEPRESSAVPPAPPAPDAAGGALGALSWLLFVSPFTDLYRRAYGVETRHAKLKGFCFAFDFVVRLLVTLLLLALAAALAYKALAPFPPPASLGKLDVLGVGARPLSRTVGGAFSSWFTSPSRTVVSAGPTVMHY